MKRKCKQCGKEFELTDGEINFYKEKGLELPKRCRECRDANQGQRNKKDMDAGDNQSGRNSAESRTIQPGNVSQQQKNPPKSGRINKYIATAIAVAALCFGRVLWDGTGTGNPADGSSANISTEQGVSSTYSFRNEEYLIEHFEKHGAEFGYQTKEEYEAGANRVIAAEDVLHKTEKEDGDDVYYLESSNEFVIVSTDGYLRTYFKPNDGINYYRRQ